MNMSQCAYILQGTRDSVLEVIRLYKKDRGIEAMVEVDSDGEEISKEERNRRKMPVVNLEDDDPEEEYEGGSYEYLCREYPCTVEELISYLEAAKFHPSDIALMVDLYVMVDKRGFHDSSIRDILVMYFLLCAKNEEDFLRTACEVSKPF